MIDRRENPPGAVFSSWIAPDGWQLRRLNWPQAGGEQTRGSLLFLGGRGDFIEKYLESLAHWHQGRWNVTSFDWRGQGGSCGTIVGGNMESFEPLVGDLGSFLLEWRSSSPGPYVAVAHSMGGHLLLRLLAERQSALDAAVLVAPMIAVNSAPLPRPLARIVVQIACTLGRSDGRIWRQPEGLPQAHSKRRRYLTSCLERYDDELWWRAREPGFTLGPPSWGWLKAAYDSAAAFTTDTLRKIETPLLLLAARNDRLVSSRVIRKAAEALPNVRLHIYSDAAHELLRESDRVRLDALARIDSFLEEQARP